MPTSESDVRRHASSDDSLEESTNLAAQLASRLQYSNALLEAGYQRPELPDCHDVSLTDIDIDRHWLSWRSCFNDAELSDFEFPYCIDLDLIEGGPDCLRELIESGEGIPLCYNSFRVFKNAIAWIIPNIWHEYRLPMVPTRYSSILHKLRTIAFQITRKDHRGILRGEFEFNYRMRWGDNNVRWLYLRHAEKWIWRFSVCVSLLVHTHLWPSSLPDVLGGLQPYLGGTIMLFLFLFTNEVLPSPPSSPAVQDTYRVVALHDSSSPLTRSQLNQYPTPLKYTLYVLSCIHITNLIVVLPKDYSAGWGFATVALWIYSYFITITTSRWTISGAVEMTRATRRALLLIETMQEDDQTRRALERLKFGSDRRTGTLL